MDTVEYPYRLGWEISSKEALLVQDHGQARWPLATLKTYSGFKHRLLHESSHTEAVEAILQRHLQSSSNKLLPNNDLRGGGYYGITGLLAVFHVAEGWYASLAEAPSRDYQTRCAWNAAPELINILIGTDLDCSSDEATVAQRDSMVYGMLTAPPPELPHFRCPPGCSQGSTGSRRTTRFIIPSISTIDTGADGNCGFRAAALALFGSEAEWARARVAMGRQLDLYNVHYKNLFHEEHISKLRNRILAKGPTEVTNHWFSTPDCAFLLADMAHCPVVVLVAQSANNSYIVPPSLGSYRGPSMSVIPHVARRFEETVIALHFQQSHWKLVTSIKGRLPEIERQWATNRRVSGPGRPGASWVPLIETLSRSAEGGLTLNAHKQAGPLDKFLTCTTS